MELTKDQQKVLELALNGENIFLTGNAGTGKTFTLTEIIEELKERGKIVAVTASTGVAATLLGGVTIHSFSNILTKKFLSEDHLYKTARNPWKAERILQTNVLIIDEISMLSSNTLDLVDEMLQFVRGNSLPFGGMQTIVCGDFFQLPPVDDGDEKIVVDYAYSSQSWTHAKFKVCYLTEILRQKDDVLISLLNNIRSNSINDHNLELLEALQENEKNERAIKLYAKNENVNRENAIKLNQIPEESKIFKAEYTGKQQFLIDKIKKNLLAPETLILKKGAHVMFLKNDFDNDIVNGTTGEVVGFGDFDEYNKKGDLVKEHKDIPKIKIFKTEKTVYAIPHTWKMEEYNHITKKDEVIASATQIPLKLSWALTIHKSQGSTFDYVNLDLSNVFIHNMGYVALSRTSSLKGISLNGFNKKSLEVDPKVAEKDQEFLSENII